MAEYVWIDASGGIRSKSRVRITNLDLGMKRTQRFKTRDTTNPLFLSPYITFCVTLVSTSQKAELGRHGGL